MKPRTNQLAEPRTVVYTPPGPVADAFFGSDAFVAGILGPIGSGKSTEVQAPSSAWLGR